MMNQSHQPHHPELDENEPPTPESAEPISDAPVGGEPAPEAETIESLRTERDELQERVLRISADYQNYVRRSKQHLDDARQQQLMSVTKGLIGPLDHFDHALGVDPESTPAAGVLDGVKIVRDELMKALEQLGVERMDVAPGDEFDPNRHEALMRQATDEVDNGRIVAQLQPGYTLNGKTLRPAKVSVAE